MKCINCGKEIKEDALFCPYCGAENIQSEKSLSFIQKREKRERERQFILSKASLTKDDVAGVNLLEEESINLEKTQTIYTKVKILYLKIIIESIIFIGCLIIFGIMNYLKLDIDKNLQIFIVFMTFIIAMSAACFLINDSYYLKSIKIMSKTKIAIKKILFGKDPILVFDGNIYNVKVNKNCNECNNKMHLEEFEGTLYAVCDYNRAHILKVDTEKIVNNISLKS